MKCPKCGFISFDYITACKKCSSALIPKSTYIPKLPEKIEMDDSLPVFDDMDSDPALGQVLNNESVPKLKPDEPDIDTSHIDITHTNTSEPLTQSSVTNEEPISSILKDDSDTDIYNMINDAPIDISAKSDIATEPVPESLLDVKSSEADILDAASEVEIGDLAGVELLTDEAPVYEEAPISYQKEDERDRERISADVDQPDSGDPYTDSGERDVDYAAHMMHPEVLPFNLAALSARAVAFFIDLAIIFSIAFLTLLSGLYILGDTSDIYNRQNVIFPLFLMLFFLASSYFVILHGFGSRTIGKMSMGISLISNDGQPLGLWEAFVRWIGYYISAVFLCLGFIWSVFDSDFQTWHDKLAGTYVIKDRNL